MTSRPHVTILPSPVLPATAYAGLADALRAAGGAPSVADPSLDGSWAAGELVRRWSRDLRGADVVVAHSNAGYLAPLARACQDVAIVFMDAALLPESGDAALAPAEFRTHLDSLADPHGLLPPWTRWWPRAVLEDVVPGDLLDDLDRRCPRLPSSYFDQRLEAPPGWVRGANAYLGFGATYEAELGFAVSHRWPTRVMDGRHLHFLHQPDAVAELLLTLAGEVRDEVGS